MFTAVEDANEVPAETGIPGVNIATIYSVLLDILYSLVLSSFYVFVCASCSH